MPSWEIFEQQDQGYKDHVIPPSITARVSVEQSSTLGWAKYVGTYGRSIGMQRFGASAPNKDLQKRFGFTSEQIISAVKEQLG